MKDIFFRNIYKSFGERVVFSGFDLVVPTGKTVCLTGPSGCGKTTLLNIAAGFLKPDSGEIEGIPQRISAVFQEDRLCEDFSAVSNIRLVTGKAVSDDVIRAHLERLGLGGSEDIPVRQLSGGMKRRVAIARAVIFGGELLLLDEAFKGLDEARKASVIQYIRDNTAGKSILCVTHDASDADAFGGLLVTMPAQI